MIMRLSKITSNQLLSIRRLIWRLPVFLGISLFWIMCSKSDSAKIPDSVKNDIDTVKSIQTPAQEDTIIDKGSVIQTAILKNSLIGQDTFVAGHVLNIDVGDKVRHDLG